MNTALFYVVYDQDIPLLYLSCLSLRQHWQGPKNIVIVDNHTTHPWRDLIAECLPTWQITVIDAPKLSLTHHFASGWYTQQIYKLICPLDTDYDSFIILDCKNLMIRPVGLEEFIDQDRELCIGGETEHIKQSFGTAWDGYTLRMAKESQDLVKGEETALLIYTITPQIFRRSVLAELQSLYQFDQMKLWRGTEFFTYWYYYNTFHKPKWQCRETDFVMVDMNLPLADCAVFYNLHQRDIDLHSKFVLNKLEQTGVISTGELEEFWRRVSVSRSR